MLRMLRGIALSMGALVLGLSMTLAQVSFKVQITATNGTDVVVDTIGVNPGNTIGADIGSSFGAYAEYLLPPAPPAYNFDSRILTIPGRVATYPTGLGSTGVYGDYRGYTSSTQVDSFKILISGDNTDANPTVISWPSNLSLYGTSWIIKPIGAATWAQVNMLSVNSVSIPAADQKNILIIKTGATAPSPGPTFSASPVNFPNVGVGGSATLNLVVTNTGSSNAMHITAISAGVAPFSYSVPSLPQTVAAGGTLTIPVTFSPTSAGSFSGSVTFTDDASGSPQVVGLSGSSSSNANKLFFSADSVYSKLDGHTYYDTLGLDYHPASGTEMLKTLQFALVSQRPIALNSITRGADLLTGNWTLRTQIYRAPSGSSDTASTLDTVIVTLYANDLATGLAANAVFNHLLAFQYNITRFDNPDTLWRSISLSYVNASNRLGQDLGISGDAPEMVQLVNSTYKGDVNNDGNVDVLDVLLIVDHILKRVDLNNPTDQATYGLPADAFTRANVAPWGSPDHVVNAQDLAVVQQMALTGQDPSGIKLQKMLAGVSPSSGNSGKLGKVSDYDAVVTFYVTASGVAVRVESDKRVKGMQFDLSALGQVPQGVKIESMFGEAHYSALTNGMRVMVYDNAGATLDPGAHLIANIPMTVGDPAQVSVADLVLANNVDGKVENVKYEINLNSAPELPMTYSLEQNYPNPFNPTTDIQFSIPQTGMVKIAVYNVLGQEVRLLFAGQAERGTRVVRWDGRNNAGSVVPTGMYIYKMTAGSFSDAKKMMLLK